MEDIYQPGLLDLYRLHSDGDTSIEEWVEVIGRKLVPSESRIYLPTAIKIKMTPNVTDPEGVVLLNVVAGNNRWYEQVAGAIREMMDCDNVDIVDYTGKSIRGMSRKQLKQVGELDVIDARTGRIIRTPTVVEPPRNMSANKPMYLAKWFNSDRGKIRDAVILNLKQETLADISVALLPEGKVYRAIRSQVVGNDWENFTKTYAQDEFTRKIDSNAIADRVASLIFDSVRIEMQTKQEAIRSHIGKEDSLWGNTTAVDKDEFPDRAALFLHIVNNSIYSDVLAANVCAAINIGLGVIDKFGKRIKPIKNKALAEKAYRLYSGRHTVLEHVERKMPPLRSINNTCRNPHLIPIGSKPMPALVRSKREVLPVCRNPHLVSIGSKPQPETVALYKVEEEWVDDCPTLADY